MKFRMAVSAVALATLSLPNVGYAQANEARSTIVVTAEHQRDWERGNEIEANSLRDLQKANENLARYSADVASEQEDRDTSRSRADNARQAFENLTARPYFSDPEKAHDWAKQVESTAKDWEKHGDRADDADRDLSRALKKQAKAQEKVDSAQRKVDEARAMMAAAERASMLSGSR